MVPRGLNSFTPRKFNVQMAEPETLRSCFAYAGRLYRHGLTFHHKAVSFFLQQKPGKNDNEFNLKIFERRCIKLRQFYRNDGRVPE